MNEADLPTGRSAFFLYPGNAAVWLVVSENKDNAWVCQVFRRLTWFNALCINVLLRIV